MALSNTILRQGTVSTLLRSELRSAPPAPATWTGHVALPPVSRACFTIAEPVLPVHIAAASYAEDAPFSAPPHTLTPEQPEEVLYFSPAPPFDQ